MDLLLSPLEEKGVFRCGSTGDGCLLGGGTGGRLRVGGGGGGFPPLAVGGALGPLDGGGGGPTGGIETSNTHTAPHVRTYL